MSRLYALLFLLPVLLAACQDKKEKIETILLDHFDITINSSGIGYTVGEENNLDSTKGLNYLLQLSVKNQGKDPVTFNEENFSLYNSIGEKMPSKSDLDFPAGAFNINSISTTIPPGDTKDILLIYSVNEHGIYRFQINSPVSRNQKVIELPHS